MNIYLLSVLHFDSWGDELFEERKSKQKRPLVMKKSDEKSFHVRSIFIVISHYHKTTVTKRFQIINRTVIFAVLETDDPDDLLDLSIVLNLET